MDADVYADLVITEDAEEKIARLKAEVAEIEEGWEEIYESQFTRRERAEAELKDALAKIALLSAALEPIRAVWKSSSNYSNGCWMVYYRSLHKAVDKGMEILEKEEADG